MNWLPDAIQLGQLPLATNALTGIVGAVVAYVLAGFLARREGADPGPAQDLVLNLVLGGIAAAKLLYVAMDPAGHFTNPLTLLVFPYGPLALPAGLIGGPALVAWGLRKEPNRLQVLDHAAFPLAAGLAIAAVGLRGPGSWLLPPMLALAAAATLASRSAWRSTGQRFASAVVLVAGALVFADLARPSPGLFAGITTLQLTAAAAATGAWFWLRKT